MARGTYATNKGGPFVSVSEASQPFTMSARLHPPGHSQSRTDPWISQPFLLLCLEVVQLRNKVITTENKDVAWIIERQSHS